MGIIFFVLFAIAEITLVVLTSTKYGEKAAWRKNKLIIRGAEALLLLGMILIPSVNFKWRFFGAIIVLAVRFAFAGVTYLIKRGKAEGRKKKGWSVVNCVVSIILILFALMPSFIFANYSGLKTTGEFEVKQTSAILVDKSRPDTFENDGSFREVPAYFYYPDAESGSFPLIVFSHGAFGYYQSNFSTYMELASHGYVVVALDHPHHAFFTKDSDGKTVIVDRDFINDAMTIGGGDDVSAEDVYRITKPWMELRVADESFVIDSIKSAKTACSLSDLWHAENGEQLLGVLKMTDTGKIGLIGHSLGGATGVETGRERDDISAVVDLDGTALGEIVDVKDGNYVLKEEAYPVPVLVFAHGNSSSDEITNPMVDSAANGKIILCPDANHMDFTDLPLISPFLSKMLSGESKVNSEEFLADVNSQVLSFFDLYLK